MGKSRKRAGQSSNSDEYWRLVMARRKAGDANPFQDGVAGFTDLIDDFLAGRIPLEEFKEVYERQYFNVQWDYDSPVRELLYQVVKALQDYTYDYGDEPREVVLKREVERVQAEAQAFLDG